MQVGILTTGSNLKTFRFWFSPTCKYGMTLKGQNEVMWVIRCPNRFFRLSIFRSIKLPKGKLLSDVNQHFAICVLLSFVYQFLQTHTIHIALIHLKIIYPKIIDLSLGVFMTEVDCKCHKIVKQLRFLCRHIHYSTFMLNADS